MYTLEINGCKIGYIHEDNYCTVVEAYIHDWPIPDTSIVEDIFQAELLQDYADRKMSEAERLKER